MLNYIWGGLIIIALVFALVNDANDIINDNWRNGEKLEIEVLFPANADISRNQNIRFTTAGDTVLHSARWYPVDGEAEIIAQVSSALPDHWRNVAQNQESNRKNELRLYVHGYDKAATMSILEAGQGSGAREINGTEGQAVNGENGNGIGAVVTLSVVLPDVNFVKLRAITTAAFDMAEFAVTLALGLIGIMALWLGLMKIAEESGLIHIVVKGVRPFMKWLFPELPKDHPAMGMISLNLAANVLGLGNAATPLGIKAMEELQKLNPEKDTATNSMCMFLALNTSSVQLLPPVTLVAIMGLRVNELMVAITLTTIFSTMAGIAAAKWYARRNPPVAVVGPDGNVALVGENLSENKNNPGGSASAKNTREDA